MEEEKADVRAETGLANSKTGSNAVGVGKVIRGVRAATTCRVCQTSAASTWIIGGTERVIGSVIGNIVLLP